MSAFAQGNGLNAQMLRSYTDQREPRNNWGSCWGDLIGQRSPWSDGVLWSSSRLSGAAGSYLGGGSDSTGRWGAMPEAGGGAQMRKFTGITRTSSGTTMANATVQAFLTANDQFVREVVSDAGGYFELPSEYAATNHYLVAYKAGSPDSTGASLNTLQPQ